MKRYMVKKSEYKPLEGKEIVLQPVGGKRITLDDIMDEIKGINTRLGKQDEFNQYIRDVFERNNLK